jgi:hypothetical protein
MGSLTPDPIFNYIKQPKWGLFNILILIFCSTNIEEGVVMAEQCGELLI